MSVFHMSMRVCLCVCVYASPSSFSAFGQVLKTPVCEPPQHLKTQLLVPFQVNCGAVHEQWEYNCSSFRKLASNAPFYRHKEADWHLIASYYSCWKVECKMIHDAHVSFVSTACFRRVWTPRKVKYHKEVREVSLCCQMTNYQRAVQNATVYCKSTFICLSMRTFSCRFRSPENKLHMRYEREEMKSCLGPLQKKWIVLLAERQMDADQADEERTSPPPAWGLWKYLFLCITVTESTHSCGLRHSCKLR